MTDGGATTTDSLYEKGIALLESLVPDAVGRIDKVVPGEPDIDHFAISNVFGDLYQRTGPSLRDHQIVILSALTALVTVKRC
jgi:hypothetical protein